MLKVSVLGIGNAGNQVAALAAQKGFPAIALNTSEKDLLTVKANVRTIVIGDERGVGKDRSEAKKFVKEYMGSLLETEKFIELISDKDIVIVASSTGGGSGSGAAPVMCNVLQNFVPDTHFIPLGIAPTLEESLAAQQNTVEYLTEQQKVNPSYLLYDNHAFHKEASHLILEKINQKIIEDLCVIRGDYQHLTPYNSIDEKDAMRILRTPGRIVIATATGFKEKDIADKSIEQLLIDDIKRGGHAELEFDRNIKRLGMIVNTTQKVYSTIDNNITAIKEFVGEPIEGFEHIALNDEVESRVSLIMAGLSFPEDRVSKIVERIDEIKENLNASKKSTVLETVDIGGLRSLRQENNGQNDETKEKAFDMAALMADYD